MHTLAWKWSPRTKQKAWWVDLVWAEFMPMSNFIAPPYYHIKAMSLAEGQHALCMLGRTLMYIAFDVHMY